MLSPFDSEEFTLDLLEALGFVNPDWRKGTGKKTNPADSGRGIAAYLHHTDVDQSKRSERWFVDCKHSINCTLDHGHFSNHVFPSFRRACLFTSELHILSL